MYTVGGMSAFVYGTLLFAALLLLFALGQPPTGGQAFLNYCAGREPLGRLAFGLGDFATVPVVLAVYVALKGVNKNVMLVASGFFGPFVVLDLGVNVLNNLSSITLAESYAATTDAVQGAAYVVTAGYILATLSVSGPIYGFGLPCVWGLVTSLIMMYFL